MVVISCLVIIMTIAFTKVWRWFHTSTKRSSSTQYFLSDLFEFESNVKEIEDQLTAVFNSITIEYGREYLRKHRIDAPYALQTKAMVVQTCVSTAMLEIRSGRERSLSGFLEERRPSSRWFVR